MVNEVIGWAGSIMLSICAAPQVYHTWKTKKVGDLSWGFLWLWFLGEVFTFAYIIVGDIEAQIFHLPLYLNYLFNTLMVLYLLYAKYYYKNSN